MSKSSLVDRVSEVLAERVGPGLIFLEGAQLK
jgi:hypothetical protein